MGKITKIDWCDSSWNPVTGCLHGCEYCYARKIAERFGGGFRPDTVPPDKSWRNGELDDHTMLGDLMYHANGSIHVLDEPVFSYPCYPTHKPIENDPARKKAPYPYYFDPTFHRYRLDEPKRWTKPRTIFVCSMADIFGEWVPDEWIEEVFKACEDAPQHRYLFLTKNPGRLNRLAKEGNLPQKHWYGYSATDESMLWNFKHADKCLVEHIFVSIEPILKPMQPCFSTHTPADWIIVGAETGTRNGKVIPNRRWIKNIATECTLSGIPLFMKSSLRELMGDDFVQEFPWEV